MSVIETGFYAVPPPAGTDQVFVSSLAEYSCWHVPDLLRQRKTLVAECLLSHLAARLAYGQHVGEPRVRSPDLN